jgi:predicted DNA-binding transcriptional regulator AlpA
MSVEHGRPTEAGSRIRSGDRLLFWPEIAPIVRRSRRHVGRLVKAGRFPAPVQLGCNTAWWQSEIDAWLDALPRGAQPTHRNLEPDAA